MSGMAGFLSYAKEKMMKFHGVSKGKFPLYLKEMEFRYNHRQESIFQYLKCVSLRFKTDVGEKRRMDNIGSRIAYFLVEKGLIQREDLEKVLPPDQPSQDLSVEEQLIQPDLSAGTVPVTCRRILWNPFCFSVQLSEGADFCSIIFSAQFMKESKFIPSRLTDNTLTVIMSNPLDFYTIDAIRLATDFEIRVLAGRENEILEAIERSYGVGATSMEKNYRGHGDRAGISGRR